MYTICLVILTYFTQSLIIYTPCVSQQLLRLSYYFSRVNTHVLQELVKLRAEKAKLLGYGSHADFILETRMAKNKETVSNFLGDLVVKMKEPLKKEFEGFMELKERECLENGEEYSETIEPWDIYHFMQVCATY